MIQQRCTTMLAGQEAACTALPHSLHADVVCDRVLRSPRCVGKAGYHRWTPAAALMQMFNALLSRCMCSVYHRVRPLDRAPPMERGEEEKNVCVRQREVYFRWAEQTRQSPLSLRSLQLHERASIQLWSRECARLHADLFISEKMDPELCCDKLHL